MSTVIENEEFGWKLLYTKKMVEVWSTCNNSFLACYKYGGIYKFCKNFEDAKKAVIDISNQLN
jgi:hypothetical protein